jgi:hypothetical protein
MNSQYIVKSHFRLEWRRLEDDFRTLIASGFEFPIVTWDLRPDRIPERPAFEDDAQGDTKNELSQSQDPKACYRQQPLDFR